MKIGKDYLEKPKHPEVGDVRIIKKKLGNDQAFCIQEYKEFCYITYWSSVAHLYVFKAAVTFAEELKTDILSNNVVWVTSTSVAPKTGDFRVVRKKKSYFVEKYDEDFFGQTWIFLEKFKVREMAIKNAKARYSKFVNSPKIPEKKVLWSNGKLL